MSSANHAGRRATICILTYGDYLPYFRRCFDSVLKHTPSDQYELRLGFNAGFGSFFHSWDALLDETTIPTHYWLPGQVRRTSFSARQGMPVHLWHAAVNLYKEPMCRLMYYDLAVTTEYVVWFDDDSFVKAGWWPALCSVFDRKIDYAGQQWWVKYLPGQAEMIQAQPWYRGVPFEERDGRTGAAFMTGGFMAVRAERLREVNFPDVEFTWKNDTLKQYGGDTLLGEIARQLKWTRAQHDHRICINVDFQGKHPAPRRGGTGKQFGSDVNIAVR